MTRSQKEQVFNGAGELVKGGCVVRDEQGRFLFVTTEGKEAWSLPKGHTEEGESILASAVRETLEETGYEVEVLGQLSDLTYVHGVTGRPIRLYLWEGKVVGSRGEAEERVGWFTLKEAKGRVYENIMGYLDGVFRAR